MSAALPQGWQFVRNADGCIGIKAPPPKDGESRRTSACVYASTDRDLHELLSKFIDHLAAAEAPTAADIASDDYRRGYAAGVRAPHTYAIQDEAPTVAQPVQEPSPKPVGYVLHGAPTNFVAWSSGCLPPGGTILYTTPPQPVPLTDEQIDAIRDSVPGEFGWWYAFARAIERAHGIRSKT